MTDMTAKKVLELILNDDWHDLLQYLTMKEIKENQIATSSDDYEWGGTHETDARHTYPNRFKLIKTAIKKILNEQCKHKKTTAINEEGNAGVFCVDCGEKLEDGC